MECPQRFMKKFLPMLFLVCGWIVFPGEAFFQHQVHKIPKTYDDVHVHINDVVVDSISKIDNNRNVHQWQKRQRRKSFYQLSLSVSKTEVFEENEYKNEYEHHHHHHHQKSQKKQQLQVPMYHERPDRRSAIAEVLTPICLTLSLSVVFNNPCWAASAVGGGGGTSSQMQLQQQSAESVELGVGLLESRVTENLLSPPSYGMETSDIFYPSWFKGTWQVASRTIDVQAPCGIALFGGNATYQKARNEIGETLNYESRFIVSDNNNSNNNKAIVADRMYNVNSIAKAAMGQYSVLDMPIATPNKLTCILAPKGSPTLIKVDLIALNRRQETVSEYRFDCSEVTREIVSPVNNNNNPSYQPPSTPSSLNNGPILKEVETTSLYTFDPTKNEIQCQQRSATFLLPSQSSPIAYRMWEAARGRPIDARFYNVQYTKTSSS